jgi:thymidylate synthase ThyX
MKVTQVSIRPTEAADAAGRPSLTPELLAASGARYSRNNEGLEAILSKIDPNNLDKSVDSIFRMIDYGHQSIADMAPVAMFIDGITIWLAYYVWSLCPTAGGQESSTRYIRLATDGLPTAESLGIPAERAEEWRGAMDASFAAYSQAMGVWEDSATANPELMRIPRSLLEDPSDRARKQVARMKRNFAFDRARYFLPAAALTNMMMIMSARGWAHLSQVLASTELPEARSLSEAIRSELQLSAPRLVKHSEARESTINGLRAEWEEVRQRALRSGRAIDSENAEAESEPYLNVMLPTDVSPDSFAAALEHHDNRYAWIGQTLRRTMVRFGWNAITFAEIRDLNRHRTGTKHCPFIPVGFYAALDQLPGSNTQGAGSPHDLERLSAVGAELQQTAVRLLAEGDPTYVYWVLLGTQFPFEHSTTADKMIYEIELRTGTGAHYRYAQHLRDVAGLWYEQFPGTRALILEGSAEPE